MTKSTEKMTFKDLNFSMIPYLILITLTLWNASYHQGAGKLISTGLETHSFLNVVEKFPLRTSEIEDYYQKQHPEIKIINFKNIKITNISIPNGYAEHFSNDEDPDINSKIFKNNTNSIDIFYNDKMTRAYKILYTSKNQNILNQKIVIVTAFSKKDFFITPGE